MADRGPRLLRIDGGSGRFARPGMPERPLTHLVFGGSFDPFHNGHLRLARAAMARHGLSRVLLSLRFSAKKPSGLDIKHYQTRRKMLDRLIEAFPEFWISEAEFEARPSTTFDSLQLLARHEGVETPGFILGEDQFLQLHRWHEAMELMTMARWIVGRRPGAGAGPGQLERQRGRLERQLIVADILDDEIPDIDSSELRQAVAEGRSIRDRVPDVIAQCIQASHCYSGQDS